MVSHEHLDLAFNNMKNIQAQLINIYEYLKRHPFLIGLLAIVITLGISYFLNRITPERADTESIPEPVIVRSKIQSDFSDVQVIAPNKYPEVGSTFPVYTAFARTIEVNQLLTEFELTSTEYPNRYMNEKLHRLLTYDPVTTQYQYVDTAREDGSDPALSQFIQPERSIQIATDFVRTKLKLQEYTPIRTGIQYFRKQDEDEAVPLPAEESNYALIPFSLQIEGKDSYVGTNKYTQLTVFVDSSDKIMGFNLYVDGFSLGEKTTVSTVSLTDVVPRLKSGKADILRMYGSSSEQFSLQNIKDLTMHDVAVQYRFVASSQQVIPYYFINATVSFTNNLDPMKIEFILPAVRTSAKQ